MATSTMDNGLATPPTTPTVVMTSLQIDTQSFAKKLDSLSKSHDDLIAELAGKQAQLNINTETLLRNQELLEEKEEAVEVKQVELESRSQSLDQQEKHLVELEKACKDKLSLAEEKQVEHEALAEELEEREKVLLAKEESVDQLFDKQGLHAGELAAREKVIRAEEESVNQLLNNLALQSGELAAQEKAIRAKEESVDQVLNKQAVQAEELAAREKLALTKEELLDVQAQEIIDRQNALEAEENLMKEKSHLQDIQAKYLESRAMVLEDSDEYMDLREKALLEREQNLDQHEKTLFQSEEKIGDSNDSSGNSIAVQSPEEELHGMLLSLDGLDEGECDPYTPAANLDPASAHIDDVQHVLVFTPDTHTIQGTHADASPQPEMDTNDLIAARLPLFGSASHNEEEPPPATSIASIELVRDVAGDVAELNKATRTTDDLELHVSNEERGMAEDAQELKSDEEEHYSCASQVRLEIEYSNLAPKHKKADQIQGVPTPRSPVTNINLAFCCTPSLLGAVANTEPAKQLTDDVTAQKDSLLNAEADAREPPSGGEAEIAPIAASENSGVVQDTAPLPDAYANNAFSDTVPSFSERSLTPAQSKKMQNADKHARQKAKRAAVRVQAQLDKMLQGDDSKGQSKEEIMEKIKSLADPTDLKKIARLSNVEKMVDEVS
jgi:hypothetical protein